MSAVLVRWLIRAAAIGSWLVGPAFAQTASIDQRETDLLQAKIDFRCTDGSGTVTPAAYLLALHPDSVRDEAPAAAGENALRASVVLFVSVSPNGGPLMPVVLRQYQNTGELVYAVNCQAQPMPGAEATDFPAMRIRLDSSDDKRDLLATLKSKVGAAPSGRWLPWLLFSGDRPEAALVRWPAAQPVTYGALVAGYVDARRDATLLNLVPGGGTIESLEGGTKIVDLKKIGQRAQAAADPNGDDGNRVSGGSTAGLIGEPVEQRQKRRIQIRLANKALHAIDLAQPGIVDTFGYCAAVKREGTTPGTGAFTLEDCTTDERRQLPLRVRGFELVSLEAGAQPTRLDPLLKIASYSVPYPPEWQGAAGDRVEVQAGAIELVLKRRIALRQFGLTQCEVSVALSVADIMAGTVSFPEPPCGTVDVQLPREMFGKIVPIAESCRPGGVAPALADGRIRCVVTQAELKTPAKRVRITWAPGFDAFDVNVPTTRGGKGQLAQADLAKSLRAALPRQDGVPSEPNTPAYRPRDVQYFMGAQACAKPLPLAKGGIAPTIGEAGCKGLPDRLDLTFEIDREKTDPAVPPDAFRDTIVQSVALGARNVAYRPLEATRARVNLPVDFNAERKLKYTNQFTKPAELLVAGAKVYAQPGCSERDASAKVRLFAKSEKNADFQWPAYAQVFDNDGRSLTNCEKSIVERGEDGRPYLTFEFTSTRAVGARRTIILARSQDLMDKPGMPKALETAFSRFVEAAHGWHKQGAPLSPVDVLSVSQDGAMRRVLSAEEAALQPQAAAQSLAQIDRVAPKTPDLSLLRLQPETKGAERVLIIMDGSIATPRQVSELRLLGSDLAARKGGSLQFLLSTESCVLWQPHAPQLKCVEIGALRPSEREKILVEAFTGLLNPAGTR